MLISRTKSVTKKSNKTFFISGPRKHPVKRVKKNKELLLLLYIGELREILTRWCLNKN